jgi:hypothetical protein
LLLTPGNAKKKAVCEHSDREAQKRPASVRIRDRGASSVDKEADCGILSVIPIADGALRVRCTPASTVIPAGLVSINVRFSVHGTSDSQS